MANARAARAPSPFGELLRYWRGARKQSQLELALAAGVSPRHLSFVETGRSRPSRELVLRLAEVLEVPLRERNPLLTAAGFAPLYRESDLFSPELAPVRRSIEFLLERHEPFPAILVDRAWNVRLQNRAAVAMITALLEPATIPTPFNAVATLARPDGLRPYVVNWEEVCAGIVQRLHREVMAAPSDPDLRALLDGMLAAEGAAPSWRVPDLTAPVPVVTPLHLKKGDLELSLFSALTTLGTAQDITLNELRLETFFPLDEGTEAAFAALAQPEAGAPAP